MARADAPSRARKCGKTQEVHTLSNDRVHTGPMPSGTHEMNGGSTMDGSRTEGMDVQMKEGTGGSN